MQTLQNCIKRMTTLISKVTYLNIAPESRLLKRSCPNLNQFFLVTFMMLPEINQNDPCSIFSYAVNNLKRKKNRRSNILCKNFAK